MLLVQRNGILFVKKKKMENKPENIELIHELYKEGFELTFEIKDESTTPVLAEIANKGLTSTYLNKLEEEQLRCLFTMGKIIREFEESPPKDYLNYKKRMQKKYGNKKQKAKK